MKNVSRSGYCSLSSVLEKMKNDIDKTISNAKTELENAKANIETTIESAKKDISRLSGMKTREQENK